MSFSRFTKQNFRIWMFIWVQVHRPGWIVLSGILLYRISRKCGPEFRTDLLLVRPSQMRWIWSLFSCTTIVTVLLEKYWIISQLNRIISALWIVCASPACSSTRALKYTVAQLLLVANTTPDCRRKFYCSSLYPFCISLHNAESTILFLYCNNIAKEN